MSCLVEFSMSPMDKGESVSAYVARSLEIVADSGLPYQLHAMGTILEGEWAECMAVIDRCYRHMSEDCGRISCTIKIDAREGRTDRLKGKVASVERELGRKLRT
jgi:uncharacterized protein (TIGR00106 family)